MDRLTGVVMERIGSYVILLTPKGEFKRVKITGRMPDIGEEIRIPVAHRYFFNLSRARWTAVAAAVILLLLAGPLLTIVNQPQVAAASVWVENPGIELTVSRDASIMEVRTTTGEGEKVLAGTGDLKGAGYDNAVAKITRVAVKLGYIRDSHDLLISYALMPGGGIDKASFEKTLTASVSSVLTDDHTRVAAIHVPSDIKEKAGRKGLTPAKYAVLVEAVNAGLPVTEKDIQEKGIVEAISSAGGEPGLIIEQADNEEHFAAKERNYLAMAGRTPAEPPVSIAATGTKETGAAVSALTGSGGESTKPEQPQRLIEPIRKTGSPEDKRTSRTGESTAQPKPGSAAEPPAAAPAGGNNQPGAGSGTNPEPATGNDELNTDDNYMGPARPGDDAGTTNDEMYKVKPNF